LTEKSLEVEQELGMHEPRGEWVTRVSNLQEGKWSSGDASSKAVDEGKASKGVSRAVWKD
jgi:hypothetical protein